MSLKKETNYLIPTDSVGFANRYLILNHDYFRCRLKSWIK